MKTLLIFLAMMIAATAFSQPRLKLFIDCGRSAYCDFNFIRQQITIADFVRDRKESDIHILFISQSAGNGGLKYSVLFLGKNQWQGKQDTIHIITAPNSSQDAVRQQLIKVVSAGITPYLIKNGSFEKLNISFVKEDTTIQQKDKWNNWNFRIGGSGEFSGDNNYKQKNLSVNFYAGRITDASKTEFFIYNSNARNAYAVADSSSKSYIKTINDYMEFEQSYVKSLSPKWSLALQSGFSKSTYDNKRYAVAAAVGVEYNIFPYKASNTKFLVLRYMIEAEHRNYLEETIFLKIKETLVSNDLGIYASITQPWGNITSSIAWYNYLHDASKNNLSMNANVQLQLFKGLSINFFGYGSIIKDQLNLPKAGATQEEILLKLRALSTSYNYYTGVGINYRFGSKFNNYVNPRFTNGRN
jgi:hypothetical protein